MLVALMEAGETAALRAVAVGASEDRVAVEALAMDADPEVREAALRAFAATWPGHEAGLRWALDRGGRDPDAAVRAAAVECLALAWPDREETARRLRDRARRDIDRDVRAAAVEGLSGRDPEALALLRRAATRDPAAFVRRAALRALADRPELHALAAGRLRWDTGGMVRSGAAWLMARRCFEGEATPAALAAHAARDPDDGVRASCIQALVSARPDRPGTRRLVQDRAARDPSYLVRCVALHALAAAWPAARGTSALLRDRARRDSNYAPRCTALHGLYIIGAGSEATLEFLLGRLLADPHGCVHTDVIELLVLGWPTHHEVTAALDRLARSGDWVTRWAAVRALHCIGVERPGTLALARDLEHDPIHRVREAAREILIAAGERRRPAPGPAPRGHPQDGAGAGLPSAEELREIVRTSEWGFQREEAVDALVGCWWGVGDTEQWARERALYDPTPDVRVAALEGLSRAGRDRADVLGFVKERARVDGDGDVRAAALGAVADTWPDRMEALVWVRGRLRDPSAAVREAAIGELRFAACGHAETHASLSRLAAEDPSASVREAALSGLAELAWASEAPPPLLVSAARGDSDEGVRAACLESLALSWTAWEGARALVRDRAAADPGPEARAGAVGLLATLWHDHPDTRPLIEDRAGRDPDASVRERASEHLVGLAGEGGAPVGCERD